ncbi:MAG: MFS transporter [Firmicutes bacterium]|nr:MFS transporter [Bacillota bacterium]
MENRARNTFIGAIIMTICSIGSYMAIPVYIVPLMEKLKVGVGQITLMFTFAAAGSLATSLLMGTLVKKFSIKKLVMIAGILIGSFFIVLGYSNSILIIYALAVLFGFSTIVGGFATAQTEINWWYATGTGKRIGYLSTAVGLGGMVFPVAVAKLIEIFGLRIAASGQGIFIGGIIILIGVFVLSEEPDKYGLKPVGYEENEELNKKENTSGQTKSSLTIKQIATKPQFWFILISIVLISTASTGFNNNASALYQSKGIDAVKAALLISIMSGVNFITAPLYGILMDKIGYIKATTLYGLIVAGIFFGSTLLYGFVGGVIIAALMAFKTFNSMLGPITLPKLFGRKEAASLVGFTTAAQSVGTMIGAPLAGFMFDATGTYDTWMITGGVLTVITVLLVIIGNRNKGDANIKQQARTAE